MPIHTLRRIQFTTVFASNTAGQAKVNALRIVPVSPATSFSSSPPSSYYIDAGSNSSYTSANGTVFSRDAYYFGACKPV